MKQTEIASTETENLKIVVRTLDVKRLKYWLWSTNKNQNGRGHWAKAGSSLNHDDKLLPQVPSEEEMETVMRIRWCILLVLYLGCRGSPSQ